MILLSLLFLPLDLYARVDPDLCCEDWEGEWSGTLPWSATLRLGRSVLRLTVIGQGLSRPAVRVWVLGFRLRSRTRQGKPAQKPAGEKSRPKRRPDWELRWALLEEGWKTLLGLWQDLGWHLAGDLTYGLPDPALTGLCEAVLWSAGRPSGIRLRPDFVQPRLAGWAEAQGRIFGIQIAAAVWAACKHPVIRDRIKRRVRPRFWRARTA